MTTPILATKLYIPPLRDRAVLRPRLVARLNAGLGRGLTLVSAAAGFGKTTLLSEWVAQCDRPVAWLALDAGDSDPTRFLTYLVAALQTVAPSLGARAIAVLQSPQPPPPEAILTGLLNELALMPATAPGTVPAPLVLVLDDYHAVDSPAVDDALAFLIKNLPPQLHLVIATREDPSLPLARLRASGQLTELRAADLRFTAAEAAGFLNLTMGLGLAPEDVAALEARTEGWIAGLQLAAISLQGRDDPAAFIHSFTGGHQFVLDYLVEEVLHQQPAATQAFLLRTSLLDRMCGPLCDALLGAEPGTGQATLDSLVRANLFVIPLDDERRWYRYHHLFADLLRRRLEQGGADQLAALHLRASQWLEDNGLELEAFQHAVAAGDTARAERLAEGRGMPLMFRGAVTPVMNWLASLPASVLDARPGLWVMYAAGDLFMTRVVGIEAKLRSAEVALQGVPRDDRIDDLVGHIATIRATVAVTQHDVAAIRTQAGRALEYLSPNNLPVRTAANWALGYAALLQGDRATAAQAYGEAIRTSAAIGHFIIHIMASLGLGRVQEGDNNFAAATATYRRVLELAGDPPLPVACEAYLGLARMAYAQDDLAAAEQHLQLATALATQVVATDRAVACQLMAAQLKLAQGDVAGATAILAQADQAVQAEHFAQRAPEVAALQVQALLRAGDMAAAQQLAATHDLPVSQARVHLARGEAAAALALLQPLRAHAAARGWPDEHLRLLVLEALALDAGGSPEPALQRLNGALALAEPSGLLRVFLDEGAPLAHLLAKAVTRGLHSAYAATVLAAFSAAPPASAKPGPASPMPGLIEPLTERELEVLTLVAQGLSNREIGERLFLALDTVKGHNRRIFEKLQVQRRTEAIAKARALRLIPPT